MKMSNGQIYLKKCPFCGAPANIGRRGKLYEVWSRHSDQCLLYPYKNPVGFDRDALVRKWNKRADDRKIIDEDWTEE